MDAAEIAYAWLGPIAKIEKEAGAVIIYGKATDGTVDSDEQIVDPQFAKRALADWFSTGGNVRQMHSTNLPPAGKGLMLESMPDGEYVKSKIVEPTAMKLVDEGVYQGYSVGISRPRIVRDQRARGGRIVDGKIVELSVVDRPANAMAKFQLAKADKAGRMEFVGKSVAVPAAYRPVDKPVAIKRYQRGAHVTVHARTAEGRVRAYEGLVTRAAFGSVELNQDGFTDAGGRVRIADVDLVAAYKGSVPDLPKRAAGPAQQPTSYMEDSVPPTANKEAFPGAAPPFGSEDKAETVGHADGCDGTFGEDGKCAKCGGMKAAQKGADLDSVLEDAGDLKDDIKDLENDLEDVAGHKADGDSNDDSNDDSKGAPNSTFGGGGAVNDAGSSDDEDDDKKDKAAKGVRVEPRNGAWVVLKGTEVLGTHAGEAAARSQRAAIKRDSKAEKIARKAAKAAAKSVAAKSADEDTIPWLIRRAHDFTCAAYKTEALAEFYPSIEKNAVVTALGPAARSAIYAELARTVKTDGGTGSETPAITYLGKALGAANDLVAIEEAGGAPLFDLALAARNDLNEAFKSANPEFGAGGGPALPGPAESITAGQFKRPYISAGHQRESGGGSAAHIPTTTHPIDAGDFNRGPLTDGHQRYIVSKMVELHDGLADWRPEICRMSTMDADGSFASLRQPGSAPVAVLPNGDTNAPQPVSPAAAGVGKGAEPSIAAITEDQIAAIVAKAQQPLLAKITTLETEVDRLGAAPAPDAAPYRGVVGVDSAKVARVGSANGAPRKAGRGKKAARIEYLRSLAASPASEVSIRAQERLARLGVEI